MMISIGFAGSFSSLASISFAWGQSGAPGRVIVIALVGLSIAAWTIMLSKGHELRSARSSSLRFLNAFRAEASATGLYLKRRKFEDSPLYQVYVQACEALGAQLETAGAPGDDLFQGGLGAAPRRLTLSQVEAVRNVADRSVADQVLRLESRMGVLATAVSLSPFLGLLGTVWGVMDAFGGMAVTGAPTLGAVAPGIAAALVTTVVGLLVAIPSLLGYNINQSSIRQLTVQTDNFAQEFGARAQRDFGPEGSGAP